jgi:dTDP-4-dehydrorhamnose reductase
MKRIVVLGANGMLGSMARSYLAKNRALEVIAADRGAFDAAGFVAGKPQKTSLRADFIINCIGVIKPYCKDNDATGVINAVVVNALFPHRLAAEARRHGSRVIQIATDCVYSGVKGQYVENDPHDPLDVYGKTKSLGEVFDGSLLNIRCSIIGPELRGKSSLLEWCLSNDDGATLNGFAHHRWNGVTTLQFAELCEKLILEDGLCETLLNASAVHHFVPNSAVDKYELLNLIAEIYGRRFHIQRVDDVGPPVDRTLATQFDLLAGIYPGRAMRDSLVELRRFSTQ